MEVLQNVHKFRVGIQMLYPYPGYCGTGVHYLQKLWVRVWMSYRTHRSSGYGYGSPSELSESPVQVAPGYGAVPTLQNITTRFGLFGALVRIVKATTRTTKRLWRKDCWTCRGSFWSINYSCVYIAEQSAGEKLPFPFVLKVKCW